LCWYSASCFADHSLQNRFTCLSGSQNKEIVLRAHLNRLKTSMMRHEETSLLQGKYDEEDWRVFIWICSGRWGVLSWSCFPSYRQVLLTWNDANQLDCMICKRSFNGMMQIIPWSRLKFCKRLHWLQN
jgi:hypothetical protein